MSIITLTTDLGIKDHYVAIIKGEIYKQFPDECICLGIGSNNQFHRW